MINYRIPGLFRGQGSLILLPSPHQNQPKYAANGSLASLDYIFSCSVVIKWNDLLNESKDRADILVHNFTSPVGLICTVLHIAREGCRLLTGITMVLIL
jgi:hypothetical protein